MRPSLPHAVSSWRQRLDRLRVKLFLAIAGAHLVLVAATHLVYGWSFDQGLVNYLNQTDEARLTPLVTRLAEGHHRHGSWDWISQDRDRWHDLVREVLGAGRSGKPGGSGASPDRPASGPFVPRPFTIDPRLLLLDAQGQVLFGPADRLREAVLRPIHDGTQVVGQLGYIPRLQMVASLEQVFVQQQNRKFAAIALGLLLAVLINAAWISRWLSRRLREVGEGAAAVAQGDDSVRLSVKGHDELARLATDFNHMAASLRAARQAREQWVADIAHELRTPLTSLKVEIEALVDGVRQPDRPNLLSLAQEVDRLHRLVDDLRLLSHSDAATLDNRFQAVDLAEHVARLMANQALNLPAGLTVRTRLDPGLWVRADPDRLDQVLLNLLQNTQRYTRLPGQLHITLQADGTEACLCWEDSPPGVPPEFLPRLTERLLRLDASRARSSGGSGLGLAIVKAIVQTHGGRLIPSTGPLGGLRWQLWFPLWRPHDHA